MGTKKFIVTLFVLVFSISISSFGEEKAGFPDQFQGKWCKTHSLDSNYKKYIIIDEYSTVYYKVSDYLGPRLDRLSCWVNSVEVKEQGHEISVVETCRTIGIPESQEYESTYKIITDDNLTITRNENNYNFRRCN